MLLILENKFGIDIAKKIWDYYRDLVIRECSEFKRKRNRYFVSENCVWINYHTHIVLTSCDYMNRFNRKHGIVNNNTIRYLLHSQER